jgi:hypothetical protein
MFTKVDFSGFCEAFRSVRPDNFTRDGLSRLYDYISELEDDLGKEIELDVISLCCDYSEMPLQEAIDAYSNLGIKTLEDLEEHTTVLPVPGTDRVIIQNF